MSTSKAWDKARAKIEASKAHLDWIIYEVETKKELERFGPNDCQKAHVRLCEILEERDCGIEDIDLARAD